MKILLIYEVEAKKEQRIRDLAKEQDARVISPSRDSYGKSLGSLIGLEGFKKGETSGPMEGLGEEMMVFSGFDGEAMDSFLEAFRAKGISPVSLKAVVTPHNVFWNSRQLFEELKKERKAMTGQGS